MTLRQSAAQSSLLVLALVPVLCADSLSVRFRGDQLFFSAPKLDLTREPLLARLRNGAPVTYDFHLALWSGVKTNLRRRSFERFVVSYDLWEEKFAVRGLGKARSGAIQLDAAGVSRWCLENVSIVSPGLAPDEPFWVRLEIRAADPRKDPALLDPRGINLANLVDLLSRPSRGDQQRWVLESGQLRAREVTP